jgi:alpha-tubulin suppressor-like RCC1 family protein
MTTSATVTLLNVVLLALLASTGAHASQRAPMAADTAWRDARARVAAGATHSCHVKDDGTARCWGDNAEGQLGDGTRSDRLVPVPVDELRNVVALAAGGFHSCAVLADGAARCWGDNASGQLGDGTTDDRLSPVAVSGVSARFVAIAAGALHTCALLAGGTARCWGDNGNGQLGDGTRTGRDTPGVVAGIENAIAISAGFRHSCALIADGTVRCWGENSQGQLGDGTTTERLSPVSVIGLAGAVAISAGLNRTTCALLADGTARCWGENFMGPIGDGTTDDRHAPVPVRGLTNAVAIGQGGLHTCALLADGTARCWGFNDSGQLGDGSLATRLTAVPVIALTGGAAIAAGVQHTCVLLASGEVVCWGRNLEGQLGNDTRLSSASPTAAAGGGGSVSGRAIAAGRIHTCALRANGAVACWGKNDLGQLGDGTTTDRRTPVAVSRISNAVAIAAGVFHTCALLADGVARCWGDNRNGQLGDGTTSERLVPVAVTGLANAVAITAGNFHTCALLADGTARCWGANGNGQLSDATRTDRLAPVPVSGLPAAAAAIAAGGAHTCALLADGTARCWGDNANGQLGDGTTTERLAPVPVGGLSNAVAIAAGGAHTCAVIAVGSVRCWGDNGSGQLGNGTTTDRPTPGIVNGLSPAVVGLATGTAHTCILFVDSTVRCVGDNSDGQLGDGTTADRLFLVAVATLVDRVTVDFRDAIALAAGVASTCAVTPNGGVFCWGRDLAGNQLRPVAVPSFTLNIDPVVRLAGNGRDVVVNVIATCDDGARLHVRVDLGQGPISGHGNGHFDCAGVLDTFPVTVRARGPATFVPGPAQAAADADIKDRGLVDRQAWARAVEIVEEP